MCRLIIQGAKFKSCMCRNKNAIDEEGNENPPHKTNFSRNSLVPCVRFLLRSKSSMQRSF